jgi:hypothetical protein
MAGPVSTTVCYRSADTLAEVVHPWASIDVNALILALPWRTFRWHKGQKHYSGAFWASTVRDLVIYESRLELARLFGGLGVAVHLRFPVSKTHGRTVAAGTRWWLGQMSPPVRIAWNDAGFSSHFRSVSSSPRPGGVLSVDPPVPRAPHGE